MIKYDLGKVTDDFLRTLQREIVLFKTSDLPSEDNNLYNSVTKEMKRRGIK